MKLINQLCVSEMNTCTICTKKFFCIFGDRVTFSEPPVSYNKNNLIFIQRLTTKNNVVILFYGYSIEKNTNLIITFGNFKL